MRFMMIVKHAEKQGPPPKSLMDAIAKLAEEDTKAGTMLGSGGLTHRAGSPRPAFRGQSDCDRWAFCRGQGSDRRIRAVRTEIEGRSSRGGGAVHGTAQATLARLGGRDRGSSDVRTERLSSLQ